MLKIRNIHVFLVALSLLIMSCGTAKYISDTQSILIKNKIEFKDDSELEDKDLLVLELKSFIEQTPNTSFLVLFPREWFFLEHSEEGDNSWYDKWVRDQIGEPPTFYEPTIALSNAKKMQKYLRNRKGFYQANVEVIEKTKNKSTKITYLIDLKEQSKVGKVEYISLDTTLLRELGKTQSESIIKRGVPIDAITFDQEKNRIYNTLQNIGYSDFSPNYIKIKGDSSVTKNSTDIYIEINTPLPKTYHSKYTLKEVNIYTDYYQGQNIDKSEFIEVDDKKYYKQTDDYIVKPSSLNRFIYLKKGERYNRNLRNLTYRKLSNLEAFRFITVNPFFESESDSLMGYNILITPHEYKWVADFGSNVFYSTSSGIARRLIGIGGGVSLINRNFRRGANTLSVDLELTDEFQFDPVFSQAAFSANLGVGLSIPKQYDMFAFARMLRLSRLLSQKGYEKFRSESTTEINGELSIQTINRFYDIRSLSLNYGYNYRPNSKWQLNIRQISLELNSYNLDQRFIDRVLNNEFILRSFTDNLLTGFLFRDISAFYSSPKSRKNYSWGLNLNFEQSGAEIFVANKLFSPNETWTLDNRYDFAQYIKMSVDYRLKKKISKGSEWASRIIGGIAIPFLAEQEIPYVKQFFVGGPNSLRGWQIRELGPGGNTISSASGSNAFFQQGDIYLEANFEYRFDLIYFTELAFFVDAGNVWTRRADPSRPNANFTSNFYKQIAVSTGWGVRFDFEYFLIRFDFAYKLRNPFPNPDFGNYRVPFSSWKGLGNVSVAINYPF